MINVSGGENDLNVSGGFDCEIMNTYRLTNTTYTEVAERLPRHASVQFCSTSKELSLFDDNEVAAGVGAKSQAAINAQAGKIAELLRATDISYLSLREEAKNGGRQTSAERGSLMAAVLQLDSDAFSYTLPGPQRRGGWRIPTVEKRQSQAVATDHAGPSILQVAHQSAEGPSMLIMNSPSATRVTGVKRKEAPESKLDRHQSKKQTTGLLNPVKSNQESLVHELCELLDEIFARTEAFREDEGDDAGTLLSLAKIRSVGEEIVKIRSKNIIQNVPVDYHLRLLSLLDQHVQRANGREVDEDDDSMNFESVMSGLETVRTSLTIMRGPSMGMAMEAIMSTSFATHTPLQRPSSSFWGHGGSSRFSCHGCGCRVKLPGGGTQRRAGVVTAYLERDSNPLAQFFGRLQGSLPIVGLLSRMLSDEGGVGDDRIQPVEFCRKVQKKCSYEASTAFFEFQERHGPVAKPQYVLLWCWAAAVGAGLLKSDDLIMSAARLRCSYDIQYETENLELLMDDATKRRANSKSPPINVPIEARAEKALDAIMKCCTGNSFLDEEDVPLLTTILTTVFLAADPTEIGRIVASRLRGSEDDESSLEDDTEELAAEETLVEQKSSRWAQ